MVVVLPLGSEAPWRFYRYGLFSLGAPDSPKYRWLFVWGFRRVLGTVKELGGWTAVTFGFLLLCAVFTAVYSVLCCEVLLRFTQR